jgi:hypothetical protein
MRSTGRSTTTSPGFEPERARRGSGGSTSFPGSAGGALSAPNGGLQARRGRWAATILVETGGDGVGSLSHDVLGLVRDEPVALKLGNHPPDPPAVYVDLLREPDPVRRSEAPHVPRRPGHGGAELDRQVGGAHESHASSRLVRDIAPPVPDRDRGQVVSNEAPPARSRAFVVFRIASQARPPHGSPLRKRERKRARPYPQGTA